MEHELYRRSGLAVKIDPTLHETTDPAVALARLNAGEVTKEEFLEWQATARHLL